ncbi:GD17882 [Drosophila simulans]|uniref:GD17882 n=1 Tax=Drosophila simulans TaxID=7240 RepID=B4QIC7_DROSI|nr:GD17882 [Drosophila simulans]
MAVNSGRIFYLCLFGLLFFVEKHEVNSVFCLNLVKYIYNTSAANFRSKGQCRIQPRVAGYQM